MINLTRGKYFLFAEKVMLFLLFLLLFIFTLYLSGNFQHFLDSTQIMLLEMSVSVSVVLVIYAIAYGCVLFFSVSGISGSRKRVRKKIPLRKYIFFLLSFLSGSLIFFISRFILVWTG